MWSACGELTTADVHEFVDRKARGFERSSTFATHMTRDMKSEHDGPINFRCYAPAERGHPNGYNNLKAADCNGVAPHDHNSRRWAMPLLNRYKLISGFKRVQYTWHDESRAGGG